MLPEAMGVLAPRAQRAQHSTRQHSTGRRVHRRCRPTLRRRTAAARQCWWLCWRPRRVRCGGGLLRTLCDWWRMDPTRYSSLRCLGQETHAQQWRGLEILKVCFHLQAAQAAPRLTFAP